jgi:Interferon-related protein conserved region
MGTRAAGGNGELAYGWTFDHDSPAVYLAVVDLSRDLAWLFTIDEAQHWAQQHYSSCKRRLYWYPDDAASKARTDVRLTCRTSRLKPPSSGFCKRTKPANCEASGNVYDTREANRELSHGVHP